MEQFDKKITNQEIYKKFCRYFGPSAALEYRPLDVESVKEKAGIMVWLKNGDLVLYFPTNAVF